YLKNRSKSPDTADPNDALTKREIDVLTLFAKGLSYKETAEALGISAHTVNDYVKSVYSKLSVNSRNEAVYEAMQLGWITV
ncbi:MAG: LuxR C-terminal-related transcriptional regulator, partial [Marinomonas sp.]